MDGHITMSHGELDRLQILQRCRHFIGTHYRVERDRYQSDNWFNSFSMHEVAR
jgi:hypothetical protein